MKVPKVLIFTPIYREKDYCLLEFVKRARQINYPNFKQIYIDNSVGTSYTDRLKKLGLEAYHIERGNNTREALARAQQFARKIAIEEDYDYLFSLESDIMVEPDILTRLMKHGKPVITALYHIGNKPVRIPCITVPYFEETIQAWGTKLLPKEEWDDYYHKGVKQVQAGGFGTCLIHKDIFKKFPFTYDPRFKAHSDVYFFNACFNNRIPVYVDTDIVCPHENSDWSKVKNR